MSNDTHALKLEVTKGSVDSVYTKIFLFAALHIAPFCFHPIPAVFRPVSISARRILALPKILLFGAKVF